MLHSTAASIRTRSLALAAADGSWISSDGPLLNWRSPLLLQAEGFEGHCCRMEMKSVKGDPSSSSSQYHTLWKGMCRALRVIR